ncbi:unnamed protein product [Acanthoscelides obtectus]|uniref:Uncharacterized protein n=1 Tax=Acanthoscelides obtectus TaxID=200917 RepID=A0A9P0LIZ7_ACAOB|nr:unnamed protein product [Acanthoscelides obtectus]CAK1636166.1 hypothetical protein AOBTE_LOCUS9773 [Acanthoscelides obtectus]
MHCSRYAHQTGSSRQIGNAGVVAALSVRVGVGGGQFRLGWPARTAIASRDSVRPLTKQKHTDRPPRSSVCCVCVYLVDFGIRFVFRVVTDTSANFHYYREGPPSAWTQCEERDSLHIVIVIQCYDAQN